MTEVLQRMRARSPFLVEETAGAMSGNNADLNSLRLKYNHNSKHSLQVRIYPFWLFPRTSLFRHALQQKAIQSSETARIYYATRSVEQIAVKNAPPLRQRKDTWLQTDIGESRSEGVLTGECAT